MSKTTNLIDKKFQSLTKKQKKVYACLVRALSDGKAQSDYYSKDKTHLKANTIYEPTTVAAMELTSGDMFPSDDDDDLVNAAFDKGGMLDQVLNFILDKIKEL